MSDRTLSLGNKTVLLNEPYRSTTAFRSTLVGREHELRMVLAAWSTHNGTLPWTPLLVGAPGVGKTRLAHELARITNRELYVLWGNEDVTADDLIVSGRDSDHPDRRIDYVLSPLGTAIACGGICLIDEIGELRASALAVLLSVLDEQRALFIPLLGERIEVHPEFRLIATMNNSDQLATMLPAKLERRLKPVIQVSPASTAELHQIMIQRYPLVTEDDEEILDHFWKLWRNRYPKIQPSPSDVIFILGIAHGLAETEHAIEREQAGLQHAAGSSKLQLRHLDLAFAEALKSLEDCNDVSQYA